MIDRVSPGGGTAAPVAPVQPVARTAPAAGAAAMPTGQAGNPMSAAQLIEARLMQALLTPGGAKALNDQDLTTLTDIVARAGERLEASGQAAAGALPYAQITPERVAELLARVDPAALHRAHGVARRRAALGGGAGARAEGDAQGLVNARLIRWAAVACIAALCVALLLWVRG